MSHKNCTSYIQISVLSSENCFYKTLLLFTLSFYRPTGSICNLFPVNLIAYLVTQVTVMLECCIAIYI